MTALLVLQGAAFAIWAVTVLCILFQLRARAHPRTGQTFPGHAALLAALRDWLSDPAEAKWRRDLAGLTLVLIVLALLIARAARN